MKWKIFGFNPGKDKSCLSPPHRPERLWGPPRLLFNGCSTSLLGVKRSGRDVDLSLPYSVEVKN